MTTTTPPVRIRWHCAKRKNRTLTLLAIIVTLPGLFLRTTTTCAAVQLPNSSVTNTDDAKKSSQPTEKPKTARMEDNNRSILHRSAFAGNISPILSKFAVGPVKAKEVWHAILDQTHVVDMIFIVLLGWFTLPLVRFPYEALFVRGRQQQGEGDETTPLTKERLSDSQPVVTKKRKRHYYRPFQQTYLYHIVDHISQAGKIAVLVYFIDCVAIVLKTLGFDVKNVSQVLAKVIYTVWMGIRIKLLKRYLVFKTFRVLHTGMLKSRSGGASLPPGAVGRALIFDHVLNACLYAVIGFLILDILQVEGGLALTSLFAFSSAGTLIFSFASKDLASQLVNGLAMAASDKLYEGEEVRFGDGTTGVIVKMGYMETLIRHSDEMMISVPNSQLANQRLCNVSRITKCQVKTSLRIRYEDAEKIPALLDLIKKEVKAACPQVITDGTRPFRAHWRDYKDRHLEVVVDVHFNLKPTGDVYWNNRQKCLMAIYRAVQGAGAHFVTTF